MFTTTKSDQFDRHSILVYGKSGAGKTVLAQTINESTLIINAENGLKSLRKGKSIDVYNITVDKNGDNLDRAYRFEKLIHLFTLLEQEEFKKKYKWLVFDSLTEIAQCLVEYLKAKHPDSKDTLKLWGEYTEKLTNFIKACRDFAPYNILVLALEAVDKDEVGRRFAGIDVNGKISMRLPALFDECFQLKIFVNEEGIEKRFLITSEYENNVAKDRSGNLEKFEEPDISKIVAKINQKGEKKNV